jgi:pimeloyl-ACP methyl ester carboxylesterase
MAYKLINERFNVRTYFNGIHLTLEDLIVKAATDGSAHFTVMGHSMGGAIAQCFGLYLATKRGISPAEIRGRTFESALALADDGGKYSSDAYYASFTDWYNLCVDSDSVSNGTIPFSILDKSGIHRLGYTVTLEDPYPDKDVESLSPLYIATQIVVSKHNMDCALETLLRAHQSHDLGVGRAVPAKPVLEL